MITIIILILANTSEKDVFDGQEPVVKKSIFLLTGFFDTLYIILFMIIFSVIK